MAHAALRTRRDAGHGGDEGCARAGRARSLGEGGPAVDPTQAPVPGASGSSGGGVGPAAGEEAHRAPGLMAPCKEKRGSGGGATRAKVRITEADLGSSGEPGPTGGAGRLRCSGAGLVDVDRAGAARTAVSAGTAVRRNRTARSSGALNK